VDVADYSVQSKWSGAAANPAQPSGLTQASEQWMTGAWTPPETPMGDAKAWAGGRNLEGETNGWSNDFYTRATQQYDRFSDAAIQSGKRSSFYDWLDTGKNPEATGVALWDDPNRGIKRGDVFDAGVKKENIYSVYDERTADVMMGAFMFDGDRQGRMNSTPHPERAWREAVQKEIDQNSRAAQNVASAEDFQEDTDRYQEDWKQETPWLAAGTGAAGGAVIGAGIGSVVPIIGTAVGGVLGAIGGGISGFMNRDQFSEVAARAKATADRAGTDLGFSESAFAYLEGAGRVAMFGLQPFQNTVQGIYDAQTGGQGDARSEWYEPKDPTRSHGWVEALNLGAALLDGVGTFSNAGAATAYMWTMGATTVGRSGIMALDDSVFNERTGKYDDIEGWAERTGAYGATLIDAVQMTQAGAIARAGASARAVFGTGKQKAAEEAGGGIKGALDATRPTGWLDRRTDEVWAAARGKQAELARADPAMSQTVNGMKFFRTAEGEVVGARTTMQIAAPSEFVKWLPTGFRARQMRALDEGAVGVDDLYRAALDMTEMGTRFSKALLMGYAESTEELAQAYLEPRATGDSASWKDLQQAALYGAAGGIGMGAGRLGNGPNQSQIEKSRAYIHHVMRTDERPTEQEWDARWAKMSSAERRRLSVATPEETPQIREMLAAMQERQTMEDGMWSPVPLMAAADQRQNSHELDARNPRADNTLRLGGMTSDLLALPGGGVDRARYTAQDAVMSAWDVVDVMNRRVIGFRGQADELAKLIATATQKEADARKTGDQALIDAAEAASKALAARKADTDGQVEMAELLADRMLALYSQYRDATDPAEQGILVERMNTVLDRAWEGKFQSKQALSPHQLQMIRRAVEFQTTRHPVIDKGSLSILRPKVSLGLSQQGVRGSVYTHQSLLKTIGGDHDGDTRVTLNFMYLPPDERRDLLLGEYASETDIRPTEEQMKAGFGLRGRVEWKVQLDRPDGEAAYLSWFARWSADRTSDQSRIVGDGIRKLTHILLDAYSNDIHKDNPFDGAVVEQLISHLQADIRNGVPEAAVKFTEGLINSRPGAYQDFKLNGERRNRMEMPWLMQQFNVAWDSITIALSDYNYGIDQAQGVRSPAQAQADISYLEGQAADRAVGLSYDLAEAYGPDPVRSGQHVHYTSFLNAAVDLLGMTKQSLVSSTSQQLAAAYRQLGSGKLDSDLDAIRGRDRIEARVLDWLAEIVKTVPETASRPNMMLALASTSVRDVEIVEGPNKEMMVDVRDGQISLLQLLLRRSLQIEEARAQKLPPDDPIHAKISRLKRMTNAQGPKSYTASQALLEVFAGMPAKAFLGDGAIQFGENATPNQLRKMFIGMGNRERNARFKDLRSPTTGYKHLPTKDGERKDPPYSKEVYEKGLMNGYSVFVDALNAVVSHEYDTMRTADEQSIEKLENGFREWRTVLDQWREEFGKKQDGQSVSDEELLSDFLNNAPQKISRLILDLIPEASRQGAFQIKDGHVYSAAWVKQMLLEKDPQRAAAIYWLQTKLEDWRVTGGTAENETETDGKDQKPTIDGVKFGRLRSRFLQSLYHVASDPTGLDLQGFLMNAYNAPNIQAIIDGVNNNPSWVGNREKLLAMHDDVALFESDPKDLWSANLPGSVQREAIQGWGDKIGSYGKEAVAARTNKDVENKTLSAMRSVLDTLPGQVLPEIDQDAPIVIRQGLVQDLGLQNLYLLQSAILNRRAFPDGLGPNARRQYWAAVQEGLIQMHNKGSADRRVAPVGEVNVLSEAFGVEQGAARELNAITIHSFENILTNPTGLVDGPVRVMMPDGKTTDLDFSTVKGALKHLMDPRTNALAKAVLFPTVRDVNIVNVAQLYMDTEDPSDFTKMLQDQTFAHIIWKGERPTVAEATRFIDMIESYVRKDAVKGTAEERKRAMYPITSMIDDFLVNYDQNPFRTGADRSTLLDALIVDVAVAIRDVSKLPPELQQTMQKNIAAVLHDRLYRDGAIERANMSNIDKMMRDAGVRHVVMADWRKRTADILEMLTDPDGTLTQEKEDALELELDALTDALDRINSTEDMASLLPAGEWRDFATVHNVFDINNGTASVELQKKALVDFLGDKARINGFLNNKTLPLIEKVRSVAYHTPAALYDETTITQEEWDQLARWATMLLLKESTVHSGSAMRLLPDGDARYFDKTGAYLAEPLFDSKILEAATKIRKKAGDNGTVTEAQVTKNVMGSLFNEKKLGVWNEFVPIESAKRRKALETSPVGLAIPTAGIDPVAYADIVGATMLTDKLPDEAEHLSKAVLVSGDTKNRTVRDILNEDPMQFIKLQNHFVKSITIKSTSAKFNAKHPKPDVTALVASNNIQTTAVENSPYSVLHVDELQRMVDVWRENDGLTDFEIEIEYVDVDKKPHTREWANNIYFDGVGRASAAATSRGPIAAMVFALMGLSKMGQQQPLDAATKGGSAYKPYIPTKLVTIEEIERTSSSITELMSRKALHMWGLEYDTGFLLTSDLPALYKMVKMRHVIRVKDTVNGGTKLVWPEELIAQEAAPGGQPTKMSEVEIIPLSEDVSRALYGASGFEAINTALNEPVLNLQDMDKFPSLDSQRLERLGLHLGETAEAGDTAFAQVVLPGRSGRSDLAGAKPRNLWKARLERWSGVQETILRVRSQQAREGVANFDPNRISKGGSEKFAKMIAAEKNTSLFARLGIPMSSLQDLTRTVIGDTLAQMLIKLKSSQEAVIWQHVHGSNKFSLADGVLTQETVANNFENIKDIGPTYGDTVVIDLKSIIDNHGTMKEALAAAQAAITAYASRGVTIALGSESGDQQFRGNLALWLRTESGLGYESLANSTHIFTPITPESAVGVNQRSLSSMNTAVEVISTKYVTLGLLSEFFSTGTSESNTYYDLNYDPQWKRVSAVILPSAMTITDFDKDKEHLFNLPQGKQRDMVVKKMLAALRDPASRDLLLEMAKGDTDSTEPPGTNPYRVNKAEIPGTERNTIDPGVRSIEDALDILEQNLAAGKLPGPGDDKWLMGDIFPVVDQQGNIFLQRLGFSLTDKDTLQQQLNRSPAKDKPPLGISVSKPRIEDGQTVTPPMKIDRMYPDPRKGWVMEGEWVLDPLSKMIWENAGFKAGGAELPSHWILPPPMANKQLNRTTLTQFTSVKAPFSKGSVEGVVDNFRDAFVVFGMDFRPYLIDFFFGKDPARDQATKDTMWNDVESVLQAWSEIDHGISNEEAATLLDAGTILRYAREQLDYVLEGLPIKIPHVDIDSTSNGKAERDLVLVMLATLSAPGVKLEHVISTSGLLTVERSMGDSKILRMPTLLTDALDSSVMFPELRKELFRNMNSRLPNEYTLDEQWHFHAAIRMKGMGESGADAVLDVPAYLQYILPAPTDQNPAGYVQSGIGRLQQQTQHVTNALNAISGGRVAIDPGMRVDPKTGEVTFRPTNTERLYRDNKIMRFEDGSGQKFYNMVTNISPKDDTYSPWSSDLVLESLYRDEAQGKRNIYRQFVDTTDPKAWGSKRLIRIEGKQDELLNMWGVTGERATMRKEIDYLVRQFLGAPGPTSDQPDYAGDISGELYLQALEAILTNVRDFVNPLRGGMVFAFDRNLAQTLYRLQQQRPVQERWAPLAKDGKNPRKAGEWEEWIDAFLGHFRDSNEEFLSMYLTDVDGFLHTWQGARPGLGDLPVSMDKLRSLKLMNTKVNDAVLSLDPGKQAVLHDPIVLDSMKQTLDMLIGHDPVFNNLHAPHAYDSDLAAQFAKQRQWLASKKLAKQSRTRMKDYIADGTFYRTSQSYENQFMKNLVNLSLVMRLANPALWFSALMEVPARNMLEHITNEITGSSIGKLSMTSMYEPQQQKMLKNLAKQLGQRKEWLNVLHDEMAYNNLIEVAGEDSRKFSKGLERLTTRTARATSDPRYGMTGTAVASRYIEAAMEYFHLAGVAITPEQFVKEMSDDPMWLRKQYSDVEARGLYSPHRAGMNRVAQVRSQKQTLLGKMVMAGPDWMTASDSSMVNFSGHLLRIPFMFTRFNINALLTVSGLTAWDQAAAMFFDGKKKPAFMRRNGKPENFNNTEIIETLDLQRTFIRSGVTYSMVMTLGLMAGGLGGDDEEERRRRRLMQNLNLPHYLDPGDSQNAFTNADAMYLDDVPFLGRFFKGAQYDDPETAEDERRSVMIPHWITKQFTSPIIGMSRFFENGDLREVGWGFWDAFTAVPHSVMRIWDEADVSANLLAQQASDEANKGTAQGQANASSLLVQIVGMYERAIFENAFANTVRNAADKYDRNPYLIPGVDPETGEMLRQPGTGLPLPQKDALVSYINEDGDVQQAYMTRQGKDGELHQYAESNLTFALVASLFSGLGESSFLRKNMAPRQQEIQRPDISLEEFEAFVMSAYQGTGGQENLTQEEIIQQLKQRDDDNDVWWDQESIEAEAEAIYNAQPGQAGGLTIISPEGREVITAAGADSVFTSLAKGALQIGDPALDGFAADQETRDQLAALWAERLVQEGVDMGLSFESANYRARRLWYGDNTNPDVPGLREIIYSRDIPKENDLVYNQLNMTYAIGPDGKPWATPFPKMGLIQALGVPIPTEMLTPGPGLRLDQQGRIIDLTTGEQSINTGLSGLEKVVELNDIEYNDDAFEKGAAKNSGKSSGGSRRRGYSGGGGGGGYTPQMRALPGGAAARFDGIQMINSNNPIIRRADVYRQRIWSERGRLKQWQ
jgi:hypothetical protein